MFVQHRLLNQETTNCSEHDSHIKNWLNPHSNWVQLLWYSGYCGYCGYSGYYNIIYTLILHYMMSNFTSDTLSDDVVFRVKILLHSICLMFCVFVFRFDILQSLCGDSEGVFSPSGVRVSVSSGCGCNWWAVDDAFTSSSSAQNNWHPAVIWKRPKPHTAHTNRQQPDIGSHVARLPCWEVARLQRW